jgi:hypothetical protein
MIDHALVLAGPMTAPCASQAASQSPQWLQVMQATGAVATTVGVLIALYLVVIRDPREASEEHRHQVAKMDALHHVQTERVGAQARKLVPYCARMPIFGDSWWTVRIDNISNAVTAILGVDVTALDTNGFEIPAGCRPANSTMSVDNVIERSIGAVLSGHPDSQLVPTLRQAIRDAMTGHFVKEWPRTLPPYQHAVMAYATTDPNYKLRITVDYEDEVGHRWRRTDTSLPRRVDEEPLIGGSPATMKVPRPDVLRDAIRMS